jgi:hypothetical protein
MCAVCNCQRLSDDSVNDSYAKLGQRRTQEEICDAAEAHLNAEDEKQRNEIVHATGIRWSELLRLPYFDPSSSVVVDAMHNLFLGLVREHFDILGIQQNQPNRKTRSIIINIPEESIGKLQVHERKTIVRLINILEAPIKKELGSEAGYAKYLKRLSASHRAALELLCTSVGAPVVPTTQHSNTTKLYKPDFAHAILRWVSLNIF